MMIDASALADLIAARTRGLVRPYIAALHGRSGAGKSTLARHLADRLAAGVIEGDDFYAGGTRLRGVPAETRATACIDWTRQRPVLETLRTGREAVWRAFDWDSFDGRLRIAPSVMLPKPVVIREGVYAARPELADLVIWRYWSWSKATFERRAFLPERVPSALGSGNGTRLRRTISTGLCRPIASICSFPPRKPQKGK